MEHVMRSPQAAILLVAFRILYFHRVQNRQSFTPLIGNVVVLRGGDNTIEQQRKVAWMAHVTQPASR